MNTLLKHHRTNSSEIYLDEENVLRITPMKDAEIDLEEVIRCFAIYKQMGVGPENKVLQILDGRENISMTKEAREYVAKNGKDYFIACGIISSNISVRLIANFFIKFHRSDLVPFKIFESEKKAHIWLRQFKNL